MLNAKLERNLYRNNNKPLRNLLRKNERIKDNTIYNFCPFNDFITIGMPNQKNGVKSIT